MIQTKTQLKHVEQPVGFKEGYPAILGFEIDGSAQWFCKWCRCWHSHGLAHGQPSGVRVSHCFKKNSPFYGFDYYLIVLPHFHSNILPPSIRETIVRVCKENKKKWIQKNHQEN